MRGAVLLSLLALGGCAASAPVTSRAGSAASVAEVIAATDLIQAGQVARLAAALTPPAEAVVPGSIALSLDEAGNNLIGDGATLLGGVSRARAVAAHLDLALSSFRALRAGYVEAGAGLAGPGGRVTGYLDAFMAALKSYDADAGAAGFPGVETARSPGRPDGPQS